MGKDSIQLKSQTILDKMWDMSHEQLIFCLKYEHFLEPQATQQENPNIVITSIHSIRKIDLAKKGTPWPIITSLCIFSV